MVLSVEICTAAQYGDFESLNEYIADGGDVNDRSSNGSDVEEYKVPGFNWTSSGREPGMVLPLYMNGYFREAPLMYYATCGNRADVVRLLLAHGAEPDLREGDGLTPLHRAVFRGFYDVAVLLLDGGADVNARSVQNECEDFTLWDRTPLIQAAVNGHVDVVRLLLRRGAALDARDCNGRSAEDMANRGSSHYHGHEPSDEVNPEYCVISQRQWIQNRMEAGALLRDVREAGGWRRYIFPRRCLPVRLLRILCEMGRAKTDNALLSRLFPSHPTATAGPETRASLRARDTRSAGVPRDVFCLIFEFWRFVDDWRPSEPLAYGWSGSFPTNFQLMSARSRYDEEPCLGNAGEDTDDEELVGYYE